MEKSSMMFIAGQLLGVLVGELLQGYLRFRSSNAGSHHMVARDAARQLSVTLGLGVVMYMSPICPGGR